MKHILLLSIILFRFSVFAQNHEYVYRNPADSSFNCYLKVFPETESIKGLIVKDLSGLPDMAKPSSYKITDLSSMVGFMTLITCTSTQFPELFTSDSDMVLLDEIIHEVIEKHKIPKENIFIGGMSVSGTRALRFAQYCAQGKSDIKIRGVFAVDPPLDLARFYNSASNHKKNFTDGMLWEANWMIPFFDSIFGGGPDQQYESYKNASVFTHTDTLGGNALLLKDTDIILFHEPDIDWWIKERGASYYDINSYDIAAFTVLLKKSGSDRVELITTSGMGFDKKGNRKPHSWSIVDEEYLINWIVKRVK